MDCARVDGELVAFQLAALDGATRAAVEAHLAGCSRCVSSYLALKRAMDASEDAATPSELVRARIRKEAAAQLAAAADSGGGAGAAAGAGPAAKRARRATWAIVAAAAAALVIAPLLYRATRATRTPATVGAPESAAPGIVPVKADQTVDTARATPENLAFL